MCLSCIYQYLIEGLFAAPSARQFDGLLVFLGDGGRQSTRDALIRSPVGRLMIVVADDGFDLVAVFVGVSQRYGFAQLSGVSDGLLPNFADDNVRQLIADRLVLDENLTVLEFLAKQSKERTAFTEYECLSSASIFDFLYFNLSVSYLLHFVGADNDFAEALLRRVPANVVIDWDMVMVFAVRRVGLPPGNIVVVHLRNANNKMNQKPDRSVRCASLEMRWTESERKRFLRVRHWLR